MKFCAPCYERDIKAPGKKGNAAKLVPGVKCERYKERFKTLNQCRLRKGSENKGDFTEVFKLPERINKVTCRRVFRTLQQNKWAQAEMRHVPHSHQDASVRAWRSWRQVRQQKHTHTPLRP